MRENALHELQSGTRAPGKLQWPIERISEQDIIRRIGLQEPAYMHRIQYATNRNHRISTIHHPSSPTFYASHTHNNKSTQLTLHLNTPRNPPPLLPPKILTLPHIPLLIRETLYMRHYVPFEHIRRYGVWGPGVDGVRDGDHGGGVGACEDAETGHFLSRLVGSLLFVMRLGEIGGALDIG